MKRAEALRPLSRDHHVALVAAKRLREATDREEASAAFLEFWRDHGRIHFRIEEEVLLPRWAMHGEVDEPAMARTVGDHLLIRRDVLRLEAGGLGLEELHEMGERLAAHVRFEERELFPLIEEQLSPVDLEALAAAIDRAEAGESPSYT